MIQIRIISRSGIKEVKTLVVDNHVLDLLILSKWRSGAACRWMRWKFASEPDTCYRSINNISYAESVDLEKVMELVKLQINHANDPLSCVDATQGQECRIWY